MSIHFSVDGLLVCLQFGAIVNKVAVKILALVHGADLTSLYVCVNLILNSGLFHLLFSLSGPLYFLMFTRLPLCHS